MGVVGIQKGALWMAGSVGGFASKLAQTTGLIDVLNESLERNVLNESFEGAFFCFYVSFSGSYWPATGIVLLLFFGTAIPSLDFQEMRNRISLFHPLHPMEMDMMIATYQRV